MTKETLDRMSILEQADAVMKEFEKVLEGEPRETKLEAFNIAANTVLKDDYKIEKAIDIHSKDLQIKSLRKYLKKEIDSQKRLYQHFISLTKCSHEIDFWNTQIELCNERSYVYNLSEGGDVID